MFLLPSMSHAANAVAVTDNTGLFLINFEIGAQDVDYRIPIGAQYGLTTAKSPAFVGYKLFVGDTEVPEIEKTGAIVLGNADVVDGMYYEVKAGEKKTFTLVSIVTVTNDAVSSPGFYTEITKLPYYRGDDRTQLAKESLAKLELKSDKIRLNKFD